MKLSSVDCTLYYNLCIFWRAPFPTPVLHFVLELYAARDFARARATSTEWHTYTYEER